MNAIKWLPLRIQDVEFGYEENPLFKSFHMNLSEPGFYRIMSTGHINASLYLLRFLAGLSRPRHGSFFSGETCLSDMSFEEFLPWTRSMGYAFESGGLLANKTVQENLLLPLQYHQRSTFEDSLATVTKAIEKYELWTVKDKRPADIPPSDYKMAVLVRALVHEPTILFLAAPEEGLDRDRFLRFAEEVRESVLSGRIEAVLYTSQTQFNFSDRKQFEVRLEPQLAQVGAVA